ncbi:hypothetical protein [Sphingomonas yantingensis]|jgi:hypothetical protein|uniref:Fe-S oxidoreductase n=2 Tax=Sphingomonas TaxID=13687 RepID=A0A3D0WAA1_9SPHN|nr:hypothetical protein [Sphingomonas yantingensis]MBB5698784.1 putative iron-regulated membrane protein [Sphingomonas yantingensis]HCB74898.1 hypothetical protein [Sphingomonas bacterium]
MKLIAMTAALAIATATAAYAQETPQTAQPGMTQPGTMQPDANTPPSDPNAPAATAPATDQPMQDPAAPAAPAADPAMQQQAPMAGQPMQQAPMGATGGTETKGGYMPSTPPLAGPVQPGATVRVQPSMSPSQAFPPPAPKAEYPICKKGQTDGCRQRGG